jgi:hypothetical protein
VGTLYISSPFTDVDMTEVFDVTGEPGRVGVSVSVTADDGTVDEDCGGVCDCIREDVWETRRVSSWSRASCEGASTGVARSFVSKGGDGGGVLSSSASCTTSGGGRAFGDIIMPGA